MNSPLFFGVIFSAAVIMVPNYTPGMSDGILFGIITLVFSLPFLFRSKVSTFSSAFFENHHTMGKKFLSLHGIIFLSIFQTFTLLWALDSILPQFFGESHNVALIGITVLAGLTAVVGRSSVIHTVGKTASSILFAILFLMIVNTVFFRYPLYSLFEPSFFQSGMIISTDGFLSLEGFAPLVALSLIIFWLSWLEMSETDRVNGMKKNSTIIHRVIGAGVVLAGIMFFFLPMFFGMGRTNGPAATAAITLLLSMGATAGLIGMFIATISSVGSLFAYRFYPQFSRTEEREKQTLMNKLAIVFSVIISVLLIPIERSAGGAVAVWYAAFLATFTSPIVTVFALSMVVKKQQPFVLSLSMVLGTISAAVDFLSNVVFGSVVLDGANIFYLSLSGILVTAVSYAVISAMKELVVVQRVLSRMNHS